MRVHCMGLYSEHKAIQKGVYDHACQLYEGCIVNIKPALNAITIMRVHCMRAV